jgi:hypothetical protein
MYVVVVTHKKIAALNDLMAVIMPMFPHDKFLIVGSEEKGYQFRVLGHGDEKAPRKFAEPFLKKWKPKPEDEANKVISSAVEEKMKQDDAEYFAGKKKVYETLEDEAFNIP